MVITICSHFLRAGNLGPLGPPDRSADGSASRRLGPEEIDEKLQIFEDRSQERERELNSIA